MLDCTITVTRSPTEETYDIKCILVPFFQRFQLIVYGANDSGPIVKQNIVETGANAGSYSPHGKQEVE